MQRFSPPRSTLLVALASCVLRVFSPFATMLRGGFEAVLGQHLKCVLATILYINILVHNIQNTERPSYVCIRLKVTDSKEFINFFIRASKTCERHPWNPREHLARPNRGSVTECVNQLFDDNNENILIMILTSGITAGRVTVSSWGSGGQLFFWLKWQVEWGRWCSDEHNV